MADKEAMIFSGEQETNYFRFSSIRAQLRMEKVGLKSSGGALRPRLAKEFGLKPRASHADYIAHCEAKMNEILEAKQKALEEKQNAL